MPESFSFFEVQMQIAGNPAADLHSKAVTRDNVSDEIKIFPLGFSINTAVDQRSMILIRQMKIYKLGARKRRLVFSWMKAHKISVR